MMIVLNKNLVFLRSVSWYLCMIFVYDSRCVCAYIQIIKEIEIIKDKPEEWD